MAMQNIARKADIANAQAEIIHALTLGIYGAAATAAGLLLAAFALF